MSKDKEITWMTKYEILDYYKESVCFELLPDMIPETGGIVVGNIDLPLTTKCSLACKDCCSLIPMYKNPKHFDIDTVLKGLMAFLDCVDLVVRVNVLGGEPMLYPDLDRVIYTLNNSSKVHHVVLTTNGTVVPCNTQLYETLRNEKNEVRISAYSNYSGLASKLVEKLESENIKYTIKRFGENDFSWYDFGDFICREREESELYEQYSKCDVEWRPIFKGKMFPCPRAAHAVDLELIPSVQDDFVDFLNSAKTVEEKKQQILDFLHKPYFHACNYCDRGTMYCKEVPVAEQL